SLVGPRPELPSIVAMYEPWQHGRHLVAPGITGRWQVNRAGDRASHGVNGTPSANTCSGRMQRGSCVARQQHLFDIRPLESWAESGEGAGMSVQPSVLVGEAERTRRDGPPVRWEWGTRF